MVEWTIASKKTYADPFNDVDVDVIFSKDGHSWRVPMFWRGDQRWSVRFAPPFPGEYIYRLESTDRNNPDLNGHQGHVKITAYNGPDELLRHGMIGVSGNRRYFEYADDTPFYWLGDTWWTGLSDRLSWDGFLKLSADRKAKGFTLVQIVAGLIPDEELPPVDPGYGNEGGQVWDAKFQRINPKYFDYADRRIQHLFEVGLTPAIVGAWSPLLERMGLAKMKQHWRYIIARYGAYPVFWIAGGEVFDPPKGVQSPCGDAIARGWTEVVRYLRDTDPYHHPITVHEAVHPSHEAVYPCGAPLQDDSLTDFDLLQAGHSSWMSLADSVVEIGRHYARASMIKPVVQGEIGYEKFGETHLEDFQRAAFWLSMLNGAAGHTYGAVGTWEAYTSDKLFQRFRFSFLTWEEGMNLPGSYQVGLGAQLLRSYSWWRLAPHPEWIVPRGTTLLGPQSKSDGSDPWDTAESHDELVDAKAVIDPQGEGTLRKVSFRRPYAAGIPGELRVIYIPYPGFVDNTPPTVLGLESGVLYHAFFWQPALGVQVDLGAVKRPEPGQEIFEDSLSKERAVMWQDHGVNRVTDTQGGLSSRGETLTTLDKINETNVVAEVEVQSNSGAALVLRYQNTATYVAAVYSPGDNSLYLLDRKDGVDGQSLGTTVVPRLNCPIRLLAEVRGNKGAASVICGEQTFTTPIVDLTNVNGGSVGLLHRAEDREQKFRNFDLRRSPDLVSDEFLQRKLYDARDRYRGELVGAGMKLGDTQYPGWDDFGRDKHILLNAYRPERVPGLGDWLLVLEAAQARTGGQGIAR